MSILDGKYDAIIIAVSHEFILANRIEILEYVTSI